jgi:hypothetical protein
MTTSSRTEAQQRADEIRVFRNELGRLEGEHVLALTEAQHRAVADYQGGLLAQYAQAFDIDRDVRAK